MNKKIVITLDRLSEVQKELAEKLAEAKATPQEINRTQLLLEETFLRLKNGLESGEDFAAEATIRKRFGDVILQFICRGDEFDPCVKVNEQEDSDDAYRLIILKAYRQHINYSYKNRTNIVNIKVHEAGEGSKRIRWLLMALIGGIVCGLLMQHFCDSTMLSAFNNSLVTPIRHIFLNALQMMVAPVTFFSIISGITNISETADIGKLGRRLVFVSLIAMVIMSFVGLFLSLMIFSGDLSYLQTGMPVVDNASTVANVSLKDMLLNIVPDNLIDPFRGQQILQTMFIAIFFGITINRMNNTPRWIIEGIDFMFRFCSDVLKIIVKAIPLMVFLSMVSLMASTGLSSLLSFSKLLMGLVLGVLVGWGVGAAMVFFMGKISPVYLTKKVIAFSPIPAAIASASASLPFVIKFCTDKLGVDSRLASFSIPVGIQLNKAGQCVYFALVTVMMMRIYGVSITSDMLPMIYVIVTLMAIAKPPIPCGGIICLSYIFMTVGVPTAAVSIILCIEPLAAMLFAICNNSTNITSTFILAKNVNMLDKDKYYNA
jgi:Na+/H+-dicarboxylate symporter